jgi:hypothetical protein
VLGTFSCVLSTRERSLIQLDVPARGKKGNTQIARDLEKTEQTGVGESTGEEAYVKKKRNVGHVCLDGKSLRRLAIFLIYGS